MISSTCLDTPAGKKSRKLLHDANAVHIHLWTAQRHHFHAFWVLPSKVHSYCAPQACAQQDHWLLYLQQLLAPQSAVSCDS